MEFRIQAYDVFLVLGACCFIFGLFVLAVLIGNGKRSVVFKRMRNIFLNDYRNPNIAFGGPFGLIKWLFIIGTGSLVLGVLVRLAVFVQSKLVG